jgi:hypothetical protein
MTEGDLDGEIDDGDRKVALAEKRKEPAKRCSGFSGVPLHCSRPLCWLRLQRNTAHRSLRNLR